MASKISRLTFLLKKNRMNDIEKDLASLKEEQSTSITLSGSKSKVIGLTMHVSKAKKMHVSAVSKGVGDKRSKRDITYHRLVFCRENADNGSMFALLFRNEDKELFLLSRITVGKAITIVSPVLEGEWNGIRVLRSNEPCFAAVMAWLPFLPCPFPDSGFVSFCIENVKLRVIGVQSTLTCSGPVCDGLYGIVNCCCARTVHMPQPVLCLQLGMIDCDNDDLCDRHGMKLQDFCSRSLTGQLVDLPELQNALSKNEDDIIDIMRHAESQIESGCWEVMGWWKGSSLSTDDITMVTPKCHIVAIRRMGDEITKWTKSTPPQHASDDNPDGVREQSSQV